MRATLLLNARPYLKSDRSPREYTSRIDMMSRHAVLKRVPATLLLNARRN